MVTSRIELKHYFLPVYWIWGLVSPTLVLLANAYLHVSATKSFADAIPWPQLPAYYAVFGLIWPLSIVIYPAFYTAFSEQTSYSFFGALGAMTSDPIAGKAVLAMFMLFLAMILPLVHFVLAIIRHKAMVEEKEDKKVSWSDYFYGFI